MTKLDSVLPRLCVRYTAAPGEGKPRHAHAKEHGRPPSKLPDADLTIALLHMLLHGTTCAQMEQRTGISRHNWNLWITGANRGKCLRRAEELHREILRNATKGADMRHD